MGAPFAASLAVDSHGNLYVADRGNNRIQASSNDGAFLRMWGSAGAGNGNGQFIFPQGVAVDSSGNPFVADSNN